jgi:predicted short-subunit dehydrogenase-like oxidoreductase (DUF2520 family)
MKVVIIGSGNTATVIGGKVRAAGHEILQVVSRQQEHAARLGKELDSPWSSDWTAIEPEADIYIVCLSDSALYSLSDSLSLPGRLVVHTAGAVPGNILLPVSRNSGVLYPLQSLRKELRPFPEIPFLVDSNQPEDLPVITAFACTLSTLVQQADDLTRVRLHLGAVIVNNFSNYLFTLTEAWCREEHIDFRLLIPLIRETANRLDYSSPRDTQTGPAARGDSSTIEKHLILLDKYGSMKELYSLFTDQIEAFYHPSKNIPPL